ncbi:MAG: acyl--CoA ligase [Ruminococcaceae bacterium]|nr:acyl--CoA ligase [Oscillospiraceae bacterium]
MTLWEFLLSRTEKYFDVIVSEGERKFKVREFLFLAEKFGKQLRGQACCAVNCESELNNALALLACFSAGVTAVPLSHRYGKAHCCKILESISPTCIVTDVGVKLQINELANPRYISPTFKPAIIMCTSGTTGRPKGAMLSEQNIMANISDIEKYFIIDKTDSILISRPLYHCAVLTGEFLVSLINGVHIEFLSGAFNPLHVVRCLKDHKITVFCGTPTLLSILSKYAKKSADLSLRHIVVSGECMSRETGLLIAEGFSKAKIYHVYGLTEACPRVSFMPPECFTQAPDRVGVPLASVSIKVLDDRGRPVKKGQRGVLWVHGDNVMGGYYNEPDLTDKVLKNGWLCTKDIASIDHNGWLKIHGRSDDMIIRAGMNIYPQEIEAELKKDPRTNEVVVYGIHDDKFGVFIGMDISGDYKNSDEVHKLCVSVLPDFQVPSVINVVSEIEKNGSGKVVRARVNAGI